MSFLPRAAGVTAMALATAAAFSFAAPAAQADPGICIDHVMENGYEATATVLQACKIAKTGKKLDANRCVRMLLDEGVRLKVASHACRIASYPD